MEEPDQPVQEGPKPKTRPGEGYTRRIQGKKKLTSVVLQEQLQAQQAKLRELQEQNDLLRMKEDLQARTLEGLELQLHNMGTAADAAGGPSTERSAESLLQAVMLDLQALRLKQSLQAVTVSEQQPSSAAGGAGPSTEAQEIIADTFASPAARLAAARAAVSAMSSDSGTSSGLSGGSGACNTPGAGAGGDPNKRMQQLITSLTPEEVQATQDLTLQELAGRLRDDIARVALVRKADGASDPAEVEKAVLSFMRTMCLSLVANDERHCIVIGMNLETMQHEGMPDSMFEEAVKASKLQPRQLQQMTIAFQTYSDEQAELLKQQQGIMQQLQLLLGAESAQSSGGQHTSPPGSPSLGQHSAATASAGDAAAAATAGPAHFMSLATGVAVKRAEGHTQQQTHQTSASTDASAPARSSSAAAEATSGAQTRSALLTAQAAAAARAAAAGGGGGSSSSAGQALPLSQAGACQQAGGGQPGQGAGSGCDPPAGGSSSSGATPSSSSGAGTSSSAAGSSSWLAPEGVLCLEDADKAEQLLLEWQRVAHRMKRQARSLASMVMNLLGTEQLADCFIAGYPFIVPTPRFCAHAVRMAQEQQKVLQR